VLIANVKSCPAEITIVGFCYSRRPESPGSILTAIN